MLEGNTLRTYLVGFSQDRYLAGEGNLSQQCLADFAKLIEMHQCESSHSEMSVFPWLFPKKSVPALLHVFIFVLGGRQGMTAAWIFEERFGE